MVKYNNQVKDFIKYFETYKNRRGSAFFVKSRLKCILLDM